jgi:hypothetical protein
MIEAAGCWPRFRLRHVDLYEVGDRPLFGEMTPH